MKNLHKIMLVAGIVMCVIGISSIVYADSLASRMSGRILLQVEKNGEAWYVNPVNNQRYFLGRPNDAFELMRKLGIGISNVNLNQIPVSADSSPVPEDVSKTWKVTHTFTGHQDITTIPFTLANSSWIKVRYSYISKNYSHFSIKLLNTADSLDYNLLHNDTHEAGEEVSNETNLYNKDKNDPYYFDVNAGGEWKIEVLENI